MTNHLTYIFQNETTLIKLATEATFVDLGPMQAMIQIVIGDLQWRYRFGPPCTFDLSVDIFIYLLTGLLQRI